MKNVLIVFALMLSLVNISFGQGYTKAEVDDEMGQAYEQKQNALDKGDEALAAKATVTLETLIGLPPPPGYNWSLVYQHDMLVSQGWSLMQQGDAKFVEATEHLAAGGELYDEGQDLYITSLWNDIWPKFHGAYQQYCNAYDDYAVAKSKYLSAKEKFDAALAIYDY